MPHGLRPRSDSLSLFLFTGTDISVCYVCVHTDHNASELPLFIWKTAMTILPYTLYRSCKVPRYLISNTLQGLSIRGSTPLWKADTSLGQNLLVNSLCCKGEVAGVFMPTQNLLLLLESQSSSGTWTRSLSPVVSWTMFSNSFPSWFLLFLLCFLRKELRPEPLFIETAVYQLL